MESIVANAQRHASDSIKNIQLDQQQDDNIIPVAPQLDDIPDEQPLTVTPKPVVTAPVTTIPSSTEKPVATLEKKEEPEKPIVPVKKVSKPAGKPFWLQAATAKPKSSNVLKRSTALKGALSTKSKSKSNGRPNPIPLKKAASLKSSATKTINKPIIKQTTKPITKPITKPTTKPKAVLPPNNDY